MRFQLLSDLHVDIVDDFRPHAVDGVDAVVVAGDVCEGTEPAMALLRRHIPLPMPIVAIAGNHEFYRHDLDEERRAASGHAARHDVTYLDDGAAVIAGARFLGATLWTDFRLDGDGLRDVAMLRARERLNDFRRIRLASAAGGDFSPRDAARLHEASLAWLDAALATPHPGPTVVVTHHAPHPRSITPRFADWPTNAAYASDLSSLIERHQPAVWVHGHIHASSDYRLGSTRIVANPKGYGDENPEFDPGLAIEVD